MNEELIAEQRRELLSKAIDRLTQGDRTAFGRRLGLKDGAFVRQMLSGSRAISEKTIRHIESIPGMGGWFTHAEGDEPPPLAPLPVTKINPSDIASRYHVASQSQCNELLNSYCANHMRKYPHGQRPRSCHSLPPVCS